jgi:hypothetical protein
MAEKANWPGDKEGMASRKGLCDGDRESPDDLASDSLRKRPARVDDGLPDGGVGSIRLSFGGAVDSGTVGVLDEASGGSPESLKVGVATPSWGC